VLIESLPPRDSVIVQLASEQQHELALMDGPGHIAYPVHDGVTYVAGFVDGRPVACGAVQPLGDGVGEVKGMYVRRAYRGRGYARLILAALEELAVQRGYHTLRLETGRERAVALGLYQGAGYHPIPVYGEYVGNPCSVCFEKSLIPVEV
jgi:ribosomal protein S18 acetylase RimI-like enzyme